MEELQVQEYILEAISLEEIRSGQYIILFDIDKFYSQFRHSHLFFVFTYCFRRLLLKLHNQVLGLLQANYS